MILKPEFYELFNIYNKEIINQGINMLKPQDKERLYKYWSVDSNKNISSHSYTIIRDLNALIIKKVLKKNLFKEFSEFPETEVLEVFKTLNREIKENLLKEYTFSSKPILISDLSKELHAKNKSRIYHIRKILEQGKKETIKTQKCFFSCFDYPEELVLQIVSSLPTKDQNLLKKKYGEDLKNTIYPNNLTSIRANRISANIVVRIKRKLPQLGTTKKLVYITDIFPNKTIEELISISRKTNCYYYFKERFGETFKDPILVDINDLHPYIDIKTFEKVRKLNIKQVKLMKPLYDRFLKYKRVDESYEEFASRINLIIDAHFKGELLAYVKNKFGNDYNTVISYNKENINSSDNHRLNSEMYRLMKYFLIIQNNLSELGKLRNPETYFKETVGVEEIASYIEYLSEEDQELMLRAYGKNLDEPGLLKDFTGDEQRRISTIFRIISKRLYPNRQRIK